MIWCVCLYHEAFLIKEDRKVYKNV